MVRIYLLTLSLFFFFTAAETKSRSPLFFEESKIDSVEIEKDRLYYISMKKGKGEEVKRYFSPLLICRSYYLNGRDIVKDEEPEVLCLQDTMPSFQKAVVGMKEGEKRKIFIHPDLVTFGDNSIDSNKWLIFEVEILQANKPKEQLPLYEQHAKNNLRIFQ